MKKLSYVLGLALLMLSCHPQDKFTVDGVVKNAAGKTLYFELNALEKTSLLDSVVLDEKGHFTFKTEVPPTPDFYRLRMEKRSIPLGVDSAVNIHIIADYEHYGTLYEVEGSSVCEQIHRLSLLQKQTLSAYDSLQALSLEKKISQENYFEEVKKIIVFHKEQASQYIYDDTRSPVAYFALFQRIHKLMIFDPFNKDDNRLFSAVATAWDSYYPEAVRTKNLVRLTMAGIGQLRKERQNLDNIVVNEIDKLSYFEINLPNIFGQNVPLSSLEGKVILLDFTAFQTEYSAERTLNLRELYNQYEPYGFEIYQVSLDPDEHFWKTGALNLPWVCVRDKDCALSVYGRMYNVHSLPSYFLIDKKGHLVGRDETIKDLTTEIVRLLKEK